MCAHVLACICALQACAREEILANGGSISHHHGGSYTKKNYSAKLMFTIE